MKYLYSFTILTLLLVSCGKEEEKNMADTASELSFYKLNGKVKSVSEKSYMAADASLAKGAPGQEVLTAHNTDLEFNENGKLIAEKKWRKNGTPYEENTYNGREKLLSKTQYIDSLRTIKTQYTWNNTGKNTAIIRRNTDNSQLDRIQMNYTDGKMDSKKTFNAQNKAIDHIEYTYDKNGNIYGESFYLGTDIIQFKNNYEYDDENHRISEERYNKDMELAYRTAYKYENGNVVSKETTNGKGATEYMEKFSYDNQGNTLLHNTTDGEGVETVDDYKYDKNGNMISWSLLAGGTTLMKSVYTYDDKNNITSVKSTDNKNNDIENKEYHYEYDSNNNWIKKIVIIEGRPKFIVERKITYYN